jgi:hypothetical protein
MPDRSRVMTQTGPPGWWLGVRLTNPPHKKILLRNLKRRSRPTQGCRADDDYDDDYYYFMFSNFFSANRAICEIMWKNIVESYRLQMAIWHTLMDAG